MPSTETSPRSPTYPITTKRAGRSVRLMEDSGSEDDEYRPQVDDHLHARTRARPTFQSSASSMPGASRLASIVSTSAIPKAQQLASKSPSSRLPEAVNQGGLTHLLTAHPGLPERMSTSSAISVDARSDNENEDELDLALPRPTLSANSTVDAAEERERLEWRSMLASVLSGDVLRGESSRIGLDKPGDVVYRKKLGQSLWWQIRARLRSRSEVEEKKRTEERRGRVVDAVLEEIEGFKAHLEPKDEEGNRPEHNALEQVTSILVKLDLVESLYPHQAAVRATKTLFDSPSLQKRIDALTAWATVVTALQAQLAVLQKWTGSEDLDITKPNTTKERALVGKNRYHPLDAKGIAQAQAMDQAADDSTFIERVMKEDNVQRTFQKRVFHDVNVLVLNAKTTVIDFLPVFEELQLPDFRYEIVRLIGFPGRLIIEMLKVRLDAEKKLDREHPNPIVINDMIYNFRVTISLAVLIKRQYTEVVEPDADKRWDIPPSLTPDYDAVLLDGLRAFFNLLQMKLKDGDKATYFRETEVLEDEWEFLCEAAEAVDGGDQVVAQLFCSLTYRLLNRVGRSFGQQLQSRHSGERPTTAAAKRAREEELIAHFGKMLDTARMRYRKLQRFARRLAQRFDNSAEYSFAEDDVEALVDQLQATDHFLVFTSVFEQSGTYVIASGVLWNDPDSVRRLLKSAFSADYVMRPGATAKIDGEDDADGEYEPSYLVVISPSQPFAWTGGVMTVDLDLINLELQDNRARLIADGPGARFTLVKQIFEQSIEELDLPCVVQQQAHLPAIQKELAKIARSTYRLSESFISSASLVHASLRGSAGSQDLIENWYLFASDHGRRVAFQIEDTSLERFSRLLMRLGISWVSFICDSCDPTDRKTFRWTVQALDYALKVTGDMNILHLDSSEFTALKKSVASLVSLLISHFDILGARSSMEAKREAERIAAMRRLQRLQENVDDDDLAMQKISTGQDNPDRSIRLVREERLRLIAELEERRTGFVSEARLVGQVLDEEVAEDRSLVFLAASSSNIALRWQQGAFIGGGANGNVYMGFNIDSGGVMAVKEIRVQDIHSSPALYKQIKEESDVMSMLSHPHIVEYYGIEVHRDRVYIFEEYCEGGSLANLLEHGRIEDEDVVRVYAMQILSGLEYLHSKAVEHRDIKPDNILLSAGSQLKLVDFGAAKVIAKGNKTMARTRAIKQSKAPAGAGDPGNMMSLAGTPMYMAPEVIRSEKRGRLGSPDIWSMGCVLLEVATGRKPWSNLDNEWAIMFHIGISTQHPPLPEPDQLSEEGIDFIERCLTLDPLERPTASELWHHPWLAPLYGEEGGDEGYIAEGDEGAYAEAESGTPLAESGESSALYEDGAEGLQEGYEGYEGQEGDEGEMGYGGEAEEGRNGLESGDGNGNVNGA